MRITQTDKILIPLNSERMVNGRPNLYRFEYQGVIVYDWNAKIVGQANKKKEAPSEENPHQYFHQQFPVTLQLKKDIEIAPDHDRAIFYRMPVYSQTRKYEEEYTLETPNDALHFDSRFEGGNLHKAVRVTEKEYNLVLSYDTETSGHTQWFYFSVKNRKVGSFKFNIVNLIKPDSLYNEGMQPVVWSKTQNWTKGTEWFRSGYNISYFQNESQRHTTDRHGKKHVIGKFATLSFTLDFQFEGDTIWIAHCYPYSYDQLRNYIYGLEKEQRWQKFLRVDGLCRTLAGNLCPVLTITSKVESYKSFTDEKYEWSISAAARKFLRNKQKPGSNTVHDSKKIIVISARVHPGETNSSYVMQGFISHLTSDTPEAKMLRRSFVFKIIPMLNPDGVIYGNYRCSLLGVDLNRRWLSPSRILHPTIYYTKRMIKVLSETQEITLFVDLHGHSRKRDSFMYGWNVRNPDIEDMKRNVLVKMVPFLMAQKTKNFSFASSTFRLERSKESTARIVSFKQLKVTRVFTMETSFFGSTEHYTTQCLENLGRSLWSICKTFAIPALFNKKLLQTTNYLRQLVKESAEKRRRDALKQSNSASVLQSSPVQRDVLTLEKEKPYHAETDDEFARPASKTHVQLPVTKVQEDEIHSSESEQSEDEDSEEKLERETAETLQDDTIWKELANQSESVSASDESAGSDSDPSDVEDKRPRKSLQTCKTTRTASVKKQPTVKTVIPMKNRPSNKIYVPPIVEKVVRTPRTLKKSILKFNTEPDKQRASSSSFAMKYQLAKKPGKLKSLVRIKEEIDVDDAMKGVSGIQLVERHQALPRQLLEHSSGSNLRIHESVWDKMKNRGERSLSRERITGVKIKAEENIEEADEPPALHKKSSRSISPLPHRRPVNMRNVVQPRRPSRVHRNKISKLKTPTIEDVFSQKEALMKSELLEKDDTLFNPNFGSNFIQEVAGLDHSWNTYGGANVAKNIAANTRYRMRQQGISHLGLGSNY